MVIDINGKKGYIADLHIHSRFSRACSKNLNIENLEKWARVKGVGLLGTGDFTHPEWLLELKNNLSDKDGKGIFYTKTGFAFLLTTEISLIYTQEKGRRVHIVILAPDFTAVDKINAWLDTKGRRDYDGRPIFKISGRDFAEKMAEIDNRIELIPAHIWTPWFGMLGSMSGFNSLKECFQDQVDKIHAVETGISSTPEMNLRLKELQSKTIVSFSDLHSFWPWRLAREATILKSIDSYDEILREIRENDIFGTIEVNPAYGKYHYDGHRLCDFSCSPLKTKELGGICPKCGKSLIVGVDYRVEELADTDSKVESKLVYEILPLHEIISGVFKVGMNTKKTWGIYNSLIEKFENEFNILLEVGEQELLDFGLDKKLTEIIIKNRKGEIKVKPGYDGVYGVMILEDEKNSEDKPHYEKQEKLSF